jgi:hypothetical protein
MVDTRHPHIDRALEIIGEEMEIAAAEQRAFEQFRSRLSSIDPSSPPDKSTTTTTGGMTMSVGGVDTGSSAESLEQVRTAYLETVMSVPHFESEYDDTLRENATVEFGADLASQLADGRRLTRTLRKALLAATESATEEREMYEQNLRQERESLHTIRATLADCERQVHALGDVAGADSRGGSFTDLDARFAELEAECDELAATRQRVIHGRRSPRLSGIDGVSLSTRLYGDLETTFPGLASITRCLETIRRKRRRCLE